MSDEAEEIKELGPFNGWQAYAIVRRSEGAKFAQIAKEITERFGFARNRQFVSEFMATPEAQQALEELCLEVWDEMRGLALSRVGLMMDRVKDLLDSEDPKNWVEGAKLNRQIALDAIHADAKRQLNKMERDVARMANPEGEENA